jgi:hypothetical protein
MIIHEIEMIIKNDYKMKNDYKSMKWLEKNDYMIRNRTYMQRWKSDFDIRGVELKIVTIFFWARRK